MALRQLPSAVQLERLLANFWLDVSAATVTFDLEFGLWVTAEVITAILLGIGLTNHLRLADFVDHIEAALRVADVDGLLELGVALRKGVMLALEHL